MDEHYILNEVNLAKDTFGIKCTKYLGAITVEVIKEAIRANGINSSPRDVFIRGIPIEIDLLIPQPGIAPYHYLLYEPDNVMVAFEVKNRGSFSEEMINRIRQNFIKINDLNPETNCFYVTLVEREVYKWAISEENLGFPSYTLFRYSGSKKNRKYRSTGDWDRLISDLLKIMQTPN